MLISVPFEKAGEILKHREIGKVLSFAARCNTFTMKQLAEATSLSRKRVRSTLKMLLWTEHVEKVGRTFYLTDMVRDERLIVNLRDIRLNELFKWRLTRELLLEAYKGRLKLSNFSVDHGLSYRMVKWMVRKLRLEGIISENKINENCIVTPKNPLDLVPRRAHRSVLCDLLAMIDEHKPPEHTLVFFGDASWGVLTPTLKLMILFPGALRAEEQERLMRSYVLSGGNITTSYGEVVETVFALKEVWLAQKLGIAAEKSQLLADAFDGICLRGEIPQKDDYFELHQQATPFPPSKIADWEGKGYIMRFGDRYVYTDRALETFKEKAPTSIREVFVPILGKNVRFITVGERQ
jgi:hypothetical protein